VSVFTAPRERDVTLDVTAPQFDRRVLCRAGASVARARSFTLPPLPSRDHLHPQLRRCAKKDAPSFVKNHAAAKL